MVVNLPFFLVGLVLLWFPRQWMRMGKTLWQRRRRAQRVEEPWERRESGNPRLGFAREFGKTRNYFDLFRGIAGSVAILGGPDIPASLAEGEGSRSGMTVLGLRFALFIVGVMIQMVRFERGRLSFFAPVFYLAGIATGWCGPWAALFGFVLVWAVNPLLGNAQAFLLAQGLFVAGFGYFLEVDVRALGAFVAFCWMPVLTSFFSQRPLVVFSRKRAHSEPTA